VVFKFAAFIARSGRASVHGMECSTVGVDIAKIRRFVGSIIAEVYLGILIAEGIEKEPACNLNLKIVILSLE
jgi:hypothetical protein